MSEQKPRDPSRRLLLTRAAAAAATAPLAPAALAAAATALAPPALAAPSQARAQAVPFHGRHQGGIATPMQRHTYFVAFDLTAEKRDDVIQLLKRWTEAAAKLASGAGHPDPGQDADEAPDDSGEAMGLPPSRLTVTFGFGGTLFEKDGQDRYGLAKLRPDALRDLPKFVGDKLVAERSGGDLSVQACADDPQVASHAVRHLARLAYGTAKIRWAQAGFLPGYQESETPRNLMGFKDGTINVATDDPAAMRRFVWAGDEGLAWMRDGSYMVIRQIRIALEHWDQMKLAFQEQTVGRHKYSGAPIGRKHEQEPLDLVASDKDGIPLVAENAHVRLASPEENDGARILRRGYSYDNGVNFTVERWPPWRQAMEFDAGLLFQSYQKDPRTGFSKIFDRMAKFDMLNQFVTHVGSGLFACPPGAAAGEYVGQRLFETA